MRYLSLKVFFIGIAYSYLGSSIFIFSFEDIELLRGTGTDNNRFS